MIKKIKVKSIKKLKNKLNYKTCKNCGKKFITKKFKQAHCSEQCKLLYKSKIHTYTQSKACLYKNYRLASTYELRTAYILDKALKNKDIKFWDYPRNKYIYYIDKNNKKRKYIIDFIYITNDNIERVIEVKGYKRENDLYKWNAAIQQGYNLDVWYLKDIEKNEKNII